MRTCSACLKQSPISAAFCTFCGASFSTVQQPVLGRPEISMGPTTQSQPESAHPQSFTQSQQGVEANQPWGSSDVAGSLGNVPNQNFPASRAALSTKAIALVVAAAVVVVAGVFILANGGESKPRQADSSESQVSESESVEVTEEYSPSDDYYYSDLDDYPADYRLNFLDGCTSNGGDYGRCLCALESMEEIYTVDEAYEIDAAMTAGEDLSWLFEGLAEMCS